MNPIASSLLISAKVSIAAALFSFAAGLPLAWLLARRDFRGKRLLDVLVNLPLVLPPSVIGYYLLVLLGRHGPVGRVTLALTGGTLIFTQAGAMLAATVVALPLFVQAARNALEEVPREVVEAARVDGASRWQVARVIVLPLAWPGVWTGVLLAYARGLGEFGATLMVAGNIPGRTQTMALAIYSAVQAGQGGVADGLALLLTAVGGLSLWVALRWRRR
ncbi:MAG: molybdate ABC transporter permease subunit [Symbiobacteriia bacterium]